MIKLTSQKNTPLYIWPEDICVIEGFTFSAESACPGVEGSRFSLARSGSSETIVCQEPPEVVVVLADVD